MKDLRFSLAALILACVASTILTAQEVTGSTSALTSPTSSIVTVACQTSLDAAAQEFYDAQVSCSVADETGKVIASGVNTDNGGAGVANIYLSFQPSSSHSYTATGSHVGFMVVTDPAETTTGQLFYYYEDGYNFGSFAEGYYDSPFIWVGPGPDTLRRTTAINLGKTHIGIALAVSTYSLGSVGTNSCAYVLACPNGNAYASCGMPTTAVVGPPQNCKKYLIDDTLRVIYGSSYSCFPIGLGGPSDTPATCQ